MLFRRLVLLLVLSSTMLTSAAPQQRNQKQKTKAQPGLTEEAEQLRLTAVSLLHSLAQSANEIDNLEDRVTVLAEIGDAFWLVDREYGRSILLRSLKEIDKLVPGSDSEAERIATIKRRLRHLVLSRVAKRDPQLANETIHDLPKENPTANERASKLYGIATPHAEALLEIAYGLVDTDPKRAATLASYSLQDGLTQNLRNFLINLRAKDPAVADGLVTAAVTEAARQHPGGLFDVLVLWDYVYQPADFYFNGVTWNRETNDPRINTSAEMKRMVLNFALNAIVENMQQLPTNVPAREQNMAQTQLGALYSVIEQVLPSMQADLPRGAADLQQALVRLTEDLRGYGGSPPSRPAAENTETETTEIEKLIEKATEASQGEARDNFYLAASLKLFMLGEYERGKEVAASIDDHEKRAMILEPLNFQLSAQLIRKKSLQEAWNVANQLQTTEYRICALARVGRAFLETGDSQSGIQALNAAQAQVSKADQTIRAGRRYATNRCRVFED